jgi:hypothetical protein
MQDRIDQAILSVKQDNPGRAKRVSLAYHVLYESKLAPTPLEAVHAFGPRTTHGVIVWTAETAGMMYLDALITVMKRVVQDNGKSADPQVQDLIGDLELALTHMYAAQMALPEETGVKHYPVNCEANWPMAENAQRIADHTFEAAMTD